MVINVQNHSFPYKFLTIYTYTHTTHSEIHVVSFKTFTRRKNLKRKRGYLNIFKNSYKISCKINKHSCLNISNTYTFGHLQFETFEDYNDLKSQTTK